MRRHGEPALVVAPLHPALARRVAVPAPALCPGVRYQDKTLRLLLLHRRRPHDQHGLMVRSPQPRSVTYPYHYHDCTPSCSTCDVARLLPSGARPTSPPARLHHARVCTLACCCCCCFPVLAPGTAAQKEGQPGELLLAERQPFRLELLRPRRHKEVTVAAAHHALISIIIIIIIKVIKVITVSSTCKDR